MVRIYEQVDSAAVDGSIAACTSLLVANTEFNREVQEAGTLGSGTNDMANNATDIKRGFHFESEANEPNETSWPAGTWTVRLNVTTGNANLDFESLDICRVDSGGTSQATIGTLTSTVTLTSGVHTFNVTGSADAGAAASDRFYAVGGIAIDPAAHGTQTVTVTNDQLIDTPFSAPPAGPSIPVVMNGYKLRR